MPATEQRSRDKQRHRTRKDLLRAAARLLEGGRAPSMDEVASEAMVSRATAYRYFPTVEALLVEAPLDDEVPEPEALFAGDRSTDPAARLDRAEAMLHEMTYRNEPQLRVMLANALLAGAHGEKHTAPVRQNRRRALIEAALAPARAKLDDASYDNLNAALALVFGTESMIVFRDVLPLAPARAREVKRWAIRALVSAALRAPRSPAKPGRKRAPTP